jgi:hypothetical protein
MKVVGVFVRFACAASWNFVSAILDGPIPERDRGNTAVFMMGRARDV